MVATARGLLVPRCSQGPARTRAWATPGRLDSITVMPTWRRHGIGRMLLEWFLAEARRRKARRVTLQVAASNEAGRLWFAQVGFRETRRLPGYYGPGADGIEMTARLGK